MNSKISINSFLIKVDNLILNPLLGLLFAVALLYFFYGVFQFVSDEKERANAKNKIMYGLLGMFIMVSAYGLVHIVIGTFGISGNTGFIQF